MSKNYIQSIIHLNAFISRLDTSLPNVMGGNWKMSAATKVEGSLDEKTKELIATAIGIAVRCESCIGVHAKAALRHGGSKEEMVEALGIAVSMGGAPSVAYASQALDAFYQFSSEKERGRTMQ